LAHDFQKRCGRIIPAYFPPFLWNTFPSSFRRNGSIQWSRIIESDTNGNAWMWQ
jgi:hypothetical protein